MNELHLKLCASPEWAVYVRDVLLPWVLDGPDLGDDVLELGPGPGLTTEILVGVVDQLTAVEVDHDLAGALRHRLGERVEVVHGDATAMGFPSQRFSAATCFTMLHHVPSIEGQDALFAEVHRVLRRGGWFVGTDSTDSPELRELHVGDTFVPVDPLTLPTRLERAGFTSVEVSAAEGRVRFVARRAT